MARLTANLPSARPGRVGFSDVTLSRDGGFEEFDELVFKLWIGSRIA
jgi:hypothetical protein